MLGYPSDFSESKVCSSAPSTATAWCFSKFPGFMNPKSRQFKTPKTFQHCRLLRYNRLPDRLPKEIWTCHGHKSYPLKGGSVSFGIPSKPLGLATAALFDQFFSDANVTIKVEHLLSVPTCYKIRWPMAELGKLEPAWSYTERPFPICATCQGRCLFNSGPTPLNELKWAPCNPLVWVIDSRIDWIQQKRGIWDAAHEVWFGNALDPERKTWMEKNMNGRFPDAYKILTMLLWFMKAGAHGKATKVTTIDLTQFKICEKVEDQIKKFGRNKRLDVFFLAL